ncbi:uncharacterized protein RCC_05636 [Ramularia collo-cygni]|uniref:EH domain-containing protein n=1 Tax=Ramularia collo-cygni TaxID=112498 RepID=A0A2D3UTK7_9PEZI|nr:uncharacterized protein RCC_05636 [Ramularia collo-cygni]CZT19781.1 uncharacterized protein RCC_05636 [Ramularia collo-cygni]
MPGPQPPSRQSSVSSNNTAIDAALVGATTAFGRPTPAQRGPSNIAVARSSNESGRQALAAVTANSGRESQQSHRTASRSPLPPPTRSPVGSVSGRSRQEQPALDLSKMPTLAAPQQADAYTKSASQQAAVLAASRARPSTSTVRPAVAPKPRRLSNYHGQAGANDKPTDTTSIPPTTSLVDLFEQKSRPASGALAKRPESIGASRSPTDTPVRSPKPMRSGITSMFQFELEESKQLGKSQSVKNTDGAEDHAPGQADTQSSDDSFASASEDLNAESPSEFVSTNDVRWESQSPQSVGSTLKAQNDAKRRPYSVSPMRNNVSKPSQIRRPSTASRDAYSTSSALSTRSIQAQYNQAYPRTGRITPLTTGDQLANALVASSLASSRAPSPTRLEPPPVPTRRRHNPHHHHSVLGFSRTPSPAKGGMLHTLRHQEATSESESDAGLHPYGKHKKKRLVRKHPNKHHEGDRKRWRDAVTERERKRYEGVWAANKGIHCSFTEGEEQLIRQFPTSERVLEMKSATSDQVSNVVAREVWSRSRLPEATLETVWDLVDHDAVGRLSREEFVVGMWLIDQRLKGRKLPVKVTESIWASVKSLQGIKIRK